MNVVIDPFVPHSKVSHTFAACHRLPATVVRTADGSYGQVVTKPVVVPSAQGVYCTSLPMAVQSSARDIVLGADWLNAA